MTNLLYRIEDYAATPTWTDITPSDYTPDYPYALATDPTTPARVMMVADNSDQRLYESLDSGDNWLNLGTTSEAYVGIKIAAELMALFGFHALDFSEDAGATGESKLGDWTTSIGVLETFRGVWVAL